MTQGLCSCPLSQESCVNTGPWGEAGPAGGGPGNVLSLLYGGDRKQISDDKGLGASWPFWAFVIEYGQVACPPPGALGPAPCPGCALGQPHLGQGQPHAFCQAFCQEPWLGHCPRTDCGRTQSCGASVCQGGKSPSSQKGTPPHRRVLAGGAEGTPSGLCGKALPRERAGRPGRTAWQPRHKPIVGPAVEQLRAAQTRQRPRSGDRGESRELPAGRQRELGPQRSPCDLPGGNHQQCLRGTWQGCGGSMRSWVRREAGAWDWNP